MTITITNIPSSMSEKNSPRTNKFQFATDYAQHENDGINTNMKQYSVVFEDTPANIETLDNTLDVLGYTTPFLWNPRAGIDVLSVEISCVCEEWDTEYVSSGKSTLNATFTQVPDFL